MDGENILIPTSQCLDAGELMERLAEP